MPSQFQLDFINNGAVPNSHENLYVGRLKIIHSLVELTFALIYHFEHHLNDPSVVVKILELLTQLRPDPTRHDNLSWDNFLIREVDVKIAKF